MRALITVIGSVIPLLGAIPYLIDTVKEKTRPNVVTWFTWSLINAINMAAAFSDGAWQTGIFSLVGTIGTVTILSFGLRNGLKKYTTFDIVCQVVALLGIPLWLYTGQPEVAVLILLAVDFAGGLPTLRHAYKAPHEETWQTFALSAVGGALVLISLTRFDIVAITMPLYIFLFDSVLIATIFYRKRKLKAQNATA